MEYMAKDLLGDNETFEEFGYANMYSMPKVQKTNIKKDFFQAIGNVFGAPAQPAAQMQYNMNMF